MGAERRSKRADIGATTSLRDASRYPRASCCACASLRVSNAGICDGAERDRLYGFGAGDPKSVRATQKYQHQYDQKSFEAGREYAAGDLCESGAGRPACKAQTRQRRRCRWSSCWASRTQEVREVTCSGAVGSHAGPASSSPVEQPHVSEDTTTLLKNG
jgi:hypothetical protein